MQKPDSKEQSWFRELGNLAATRRIQIFTLGRFSILRDGEPIASEGPGKPLQLLKVLVALGGREVPEARLYEFLWPDAEGDKAHSNFTTTLSRLRRLLGVDSLILSNAHLSLNDELCWVDCWTLERSLTRLEQLLAHNASSQPLERGDIDGLVDFMFALYRGEFLHSEPRAGWLLPMRERLRSRFMRTVRGMIRFYRQQGGACEAVIDLYERAREVDPGSEEYCRGLMRCHAANGNRSQALMIFDTCCQMLKEHFDIEPSVQTTNLYRVIKNADQNLHIELCELCAGETD